MSVCYFRASHSIGGGNVKRYRHSDRLLDRNLRDVETRKEGNFGVAKQRTESLAGGRVGFKGRNTFATRKKGKVSEGDNQILRM